MPPLSVCTAGNAVRAREVGGAQVQEDREVSSGVTGPKSKICVVEFVTAVGINTPFIRTLGHDEKAYTFATRVVQRTETPTRASCQVPQNSCSLKTSPTVENALMLKSPPDDVDVVLHHVSVKASKKRGRGVALFAHNIVEMC